MSRGSRALGVLFLAALLVSCTSGGDGRVQVVASLYPLAWAAAEVGGDRVAVDDLTPPGAEAHEATLSAEQRAAVEEAAVVLLLGRFGFQPDVERATADAPGLVVRVTDDLPLAPGSGELRFDPHVWLDPTMMGRIVEEVAEALAAVDREGAEAYRDRAAALRSDLDRLDAEYRDGLADCEYGTIVVTHEAFGYLAARYGLEQLGIEGLAPESEPGAAAVEGAVEAIRSGRAAQVVFHEATDEGLRTGRAVAADAEVPVLPLSTLESRPPTGDYLSVMRANLEALREGLRCR